MPSRGFYFLRHGETDWNVEGRMQGHIDVPLNDRGRQQSQDCIPALKNIGIQRIISSPLSRAYETALIVKKALDLPLNIDDRLKEKSFGIFEGKTREEIELFKKDNLDQFGQFEPELGDLLAPGAEAYRVIHDRVLEVVKENLDKYPEEKLLFVSHGIVRFVLSRHFTGSPDIGPNAQPFHFAKNGETWELHKIEPSP